MFHETCYIVLVAQAILLSVLKFTPFTQGYHMKSSSSDIWKTEHKTLALIPHIFATKQKNGNCNQANTCINYIPASLLSTLLVLT